MKIPFSEFAKDIKPLLSGFDVNYEIENVRSSLESGAKEVVDVVGQDIYNKAVLFFEGGSYDPNGTTNDDLLTLAVQKAVAYAGFYVHFPYLSVNIDGSGMKRNENENEKTAYKYQENAVKENLIDTSQIKINELIILLNDKKTNYTLWTPQTGYVIGDIVYNSDKDKYYQCNTDHTSSDDFNADIGNWTELDKNTDIVFWEWTESDGYTQFVNGLFRKAEEFVRYNGTNEYFFFKTRFIIDEIINDLEQTLDLDEIRKQIRYNNLTPDNEKKLKLTQRFISYKTLSLAMIRFDYFALPKNYRKTITHEMQRSSNRDKLETDIRYKISATIENKANVYISALEDFLDKLKEEANPETENYDVNDIDGITSNDKFYGIF